MIKLFSVVLYKWHAACFQKSIVSSDIDSDRDQS